MLLVNRFQDSTAQDTGYNIGFAIGQNLPYVLILIVAFFVFRYFKNKSKQ